MNEIYLLQLFSDVARDNGLPFGIRTADDSLGQSYYVFIGKYQWWVQRFDQYNMLAALSSIRGEIIADYREKEKAK